jgi:hypothetical protein
MHRPSARRSRIQSGSQWQFFRRLSAIFLCSNVHNRRQHSRLATVEYSDRKSLPYKILCRQTESSPPQIRGSPIASRKMAKTVSRCHIVWRSQVCLAKCAWDGSGCGLVHNRHFLRNDASTITPAHDRLEGDCSVARAELTRPSRPTRPCAARVSGALHLYHAPCSAIFPKNSLLFKVRALFALQRHVVTVPADDVFTPQRLSRGPGGAASH